MYKIKNTYGGKIILGDLNVHLRDQQEVDLDTIVPREKSELSLHLRRAIEKNIVTVIEKSTVTAGIDAAALNDLENRLRQQISEEFAHNTQPPPLPIVIPPAQHTDLSGINSKIDAILAAIASGTIGVGFSKDSEEVLSGGLEDDTQADIHSKVIERLRKNAEGHVESKEETKESDVSDRADELEGFL